ncbi:acyltransferase family protein [Sphingomonas sp. DC1100-1]|uniref:acyltransferase family protein n=1 Tax=unclassified Sphingomonas TaxID=196159 RepID=UPI003CED4D38
MSAKPQPPALSPRVRALLDAARACAALYVVAHHVAKGYGFPGPTGPLLRFGQEAVIVFFLLSGFVIFANERVRALSPRGYAWRRVRRIYPPLIVAMIVSTLVYWDNGTLARYFDAGRLIGTLLAVQDVSTLKPGVWADPYLGNDPLWSLSYEIAFYIIFPPTLALWTKRPALTTHAVGAIGCGAYALFAMVPNHLALVIAYYPLWWAGAMAAQAYLDGERAVRAIAVPLAWLIALCGVALVVALVQPRYGIGLYPILPLRHFVVAAVVVAVMFGPAGRWMARASAWSPALWSGVASISYGLYVLHMPLLVDWQRAKGAGGFALAAVLLVVLAWAVERWLPRLLPRAPSR